MKVIGLTGGIGSGKSTVAGYFKALGAATIDADEIAHRLTHANSEANQQIRAIWGSGVVDGAGVLNRAALRERVFSDDAALARLEAILHPRIRETIAQELEAFAVAGHRYCIVEVPLLFEKGFDSLVQQVIVVDIPESAQIQRVSARSGLSDTEIEGIMAQQLGRDERLRKADYVLDNSGAPADAETRVAELHALFLNGQQSGD